MFRLMSKIAKTPATVTRWAPLGLHAKVRQHITHRPQAVPIRRLASVTTNNNGIKPRFENLERKLGAYENVFFETGRDKGWANFGHCLVIRSEIELTPEQVTRAFENLQRRNKIMRVAVTVKDGENYFTEVPGAPDVEFLQTTDKRGVVISEHQHQFPFEQLLWRCRVLTPEISDQGYLYPFIVTVQACILDITSYIVNIVPDLVDCLDKVVYQVEESDIEGHPLMPPREHLLDQYPDSIFDNITPSKTNCNNALAVKLHEMHKPIHPQRCYGITGFLLDKEQTSQLLQAAKKHNATLNSACIAAHAIALYRLLVEIGILTEDQEWSLQSPFCVDLRRYAKPQLPLSQSGDYVATLNNNITILPNMIGRNSNKAAWELAASIRREIRELVNKPEPILEKVKKFDEFYHTMFKPDRESYYRSCGPAEDLFYISMYADHQVPPEKGKMKFEKMELITGTTGQPLFCQDIHRLNASRLLHWDLSYSKMLVSDELAERYISLIKEEVERYLADGRDN